eukprot:CAMPEP_0194495758 /NCGR_PEP_ID=MMETSP0253-20130528/13249_1 /TAXON_ID=2966 /ORGANISM="Noctiluca scintillans" /LENGTH=275 /DNA_ID=CAMNT_0039337067 /DNA_START=36 /DNA_END=863 /DNA_ORIENTATION=+
MPGSDAVVETLETISIEVLAEGVFHVKLNRPRSRNALSWQSWLDLKTAFDGLAANGECRAIVLSGSGKGFCSGIDLKDADNVPPQHTDPARKGLRFMRHVKSMQDGISAVEACLKPTIAVVHGTCIGAGIDLITAADVRICTQDSVFCVKEVAVGLAADVGTLARMPKIVGNDSTMRELALTARNFFADEAKSIGLVSRVLPELDSALADAQQVAETIARSSPIAVLGTKKNLNFARDHSVQESLDYVSTWNAAMIQTEDLAWAISSKTPKFSKL